MGILSGKVAVITGSSRGLGYGIAEAYAQAGAAVVLTARNQDSLDQAVQKLHDQGYQAAGRTGDAAAIEDMQALAKLAVDSFGRIDIWVNNAGTGGTYGPTMSLSTADFERVIRTNILGVYYGSQVAIKYFLLQHNGKLINLLGRGDDGPVPLQNAYGSSKTWVRSFTLALAKEYQGTGIGIFAFNPGLVLTELLTKVDAVEGYGKQVRPLETVMHFWGKPPEYPARKALWLASSATDGKTGLVVKVLTPWLLVSGALKELFRRMLRRPDFIPALTVREVPPAV